MVRFEELTVVKKANHTKVAGVYILSEFWDKIRIHVLNTCKSRILFEVESLHSIGKNKQVTLVLKAKMVLLNVVEAMVYCDVGNEGGIPIEEV